MNHRLASLGAIALLMTACLRGQVSVCDLFKDLKASDGRQLIVTGDLLISKDVAMLGTAYCDDWLNTVLGQPTLNLRPSSRVSSDQLKKFRDARSVADRLRSERKLVNASATFTGRLRVAKVKGLPGDLIFDTVENLKVEALPDAAVLPVIPICELFQNLAAYKDQRIAVRAESYSTLEGFWIVGRCKGAFVTNGYRWNVFLNYREVANEVAGVQRPSGKPKNWDLYGGRNSIVSTATYVGRLRMRDQYTAECRADGDYTANGFGHLNGAAGELIVDTILNPELAPGTQTDDEDPREPPCRPPNFTELCAQASTLFDAVHQGCSDRTSELIARDGIDSKNGSESRALTAAIRRGDETLVKFLIDNGAPVNPIVPLVWPPIFDAVNEGSPQILKLLLHEGAKADGLDNNGATALATEAFFSPRMAKLLLEAGANPNATDKHGETALMGASSYGYDQAVKLLLDHNAEVNLKDNKGRSALMHAATGPYVDAIPLLLAKGADLNAKDKDGKTALKLAKQHKNGVAIELLSAAMKR